jgi:putative transposase
VRDEQELQALVDYVHINPLKHGLVTALSDWSHSTFHRYVRNGWLPRDWAAAPGLGGGFGER